MPHSPKDTPPPVETLTVENENLRDGLVQEIAEIISDTADIDVGAEQYATAIVDKMKMVGLTKIALVHAQIQQRFTDLVEAVSDVYYAANWVPDSADDPIDADKQDQLWRTLRDAAGLESAAPASSPERPIDFTQRMDEQYRKAFPTQPRLSQDDEELANFPSGAIVNGQICLDRIETTYSFECEAGPLANCADWQTLRQCFGYLADEAARLSARAQRAEVKNRHLKQALAQAGDNIELQEAEQRGYARAAAELSSCRSECEGLREAIKDKTGTAAFMLELKWRDEKIAALEQLNSQLAALQPKGEGK